MYLISAHNLRKEQASDEEVGMQILEKSFKVCSNWQGKCKALSAFHNTDKNLYMIKTYSELHQKVRYLPKKFFSLNSIFL